MKNQNGKIIITGADGYIGSNLRDFLETKGYEVYPLTQGESKKERFYQVEITDEESVFKVINNINPNIVIHTAGKASLAQCEKDKHSAWKINVEGTKNVIAAIKRINPIIKLVFLSSDYVFSGEKGNYKENDEPNPLTYYGKTKVESENNIKENLENYIICRTANVYGRGGNFFNFIVESLNKNVKIEVFEDVFYTPTYIDYFLDCLNKLLESDFKGIIHAVGREKISRYDFALIVADILGKDKNLVLAVKQATDGLIAKDCSLNSGFIQGYLKNFCPSIEDSLRYCLRNLIYPYFYFGDKRGKILGLIQGLKWEEVNYIESLKNQTRGNHYHKKTTEGFFIIEGKIKVTLNFIEEKKKEVFNAENGDFFIVKPGTIHTFEVLEDSKWINMLSEPMIEGANDIHKIIN